jgi:type VI secretion system protein ImpK
MSDIDPPHAWLARIEPTLAAIRTLAEADVRAEPARALLDDVLGALRADADRARTPSADTDDVIYALAAFADETLLARPALREAWLPRMLQLARFGENTAGIGFYVRLERLRSDPSRAAALAVYHLVLCLGFRGQYGLADETRRAELVESVHLDLLRYGASGEVPLAPDAVPARGVASASRPERWLLVAGVGSVVLGCALWALFALDLVVRAATALG